MKFTEYINEKKLDFSDAYNANDLVFYVLEQASRKEKDIIDMKRDSDNSFKIKIKNGIVGKMTFDPSFKF